MPFFKHNTGQLQRSKRLEKLSEKDGIRHLIVNSVGDSYIGEWKKNKKSGKGVILTRNRDSYEGDIDHDFRDGFGVLAYELPEYKVFSLAYRGDWKNGRMDGFGIRIYKDGSFYIGHWKRSKRHGHGRMWYADKSFYDGDWVKDVRQGLGLLVRKDTNRYEGEWYNDMKHGKGRFFFLSTGVIQDGVWYENYCVYSCFYNVPYRQTAIKPTVNPIPKVCLQNCYEICSSQEERALLGLKESCVNIVSPDIRSPSTSPRFSVQEK